MNSRERVLTAINFQKPDRVPIDLGGIRASGISALAYRRLTERMGLRAPVKIHDSMQLLAEVESEVLARWGVDVVPLDPASALWAPQPHSNGVKRAMFGGQLEVWFPPGTNLTPETDGSWRLRDAAGAAYAQMPPNGHYFDFIVPTMAGRKIDPARFCPSYDVPDETLAAFAARARRLYEDTDKAILGWGASISFFGLSSLLSDNITQGSLDEWYLMLMSEQETATEMMGRATDAAIAKLKLFHEAAGDRVFAWGVASDDAGTQRGEILSPDLFAEMIVPHYRRICDWVHTHTNWKTYLHSCGSVHRYIPYWIDAGIDILNPVQISAANMSPEELMRDFGGRIVFWGGGCDTQRVLPNGSPDEVRAHVRRNIDVFTRAGTAGGFVFTQVHNIQHDVPPENIEAMLDEALTHGRRIYARKE